MASGLPKHLLPTRLVVLGLMAASCVSVIETSEVLVEVTLPCETWGEASGPFRVSLHRTEEGAQEGGCSTNVDGETVQCFTSDFAVGVSCDQPAHLVFLAGNLPETFGVRVASEGSQMGYALMQAGTAGQRSIEVNPDMNPTDLTDYPWCSTVATCMAGAEEAATQCDHSLNPTPSPTATQPPPTGPTPSPTATGPDPSQTELSPSPSPEQSPSPTAGQPTPTATTSTNSTPTATP